MHPSIDSKGDLPDPAGPISNTVSPGSTASETDCTAATAAGPFPYVFETPWASRQAAMSGAEQAGGVEPAGPAHREQRRRGAGQHDEQQQPPDQRRLERQRDAGLLERGAAQDS